MSFFIKSDGMYAMWLITYNYAVKIWILINTMCEGCLDPAEPL